MNGVEQAYRFSKELSDELSNHHFLCAPFRPGCHLHRGAVRILLPDGEFHTVKFTIGGDTDIQELAGQVRRELNERQAERRRMG